MTRRSHFFSRLRRSPGSASADSRPKELGFDSCATRMAPRELPVDLAGQITGGSIIDLLGTSASELRESARRELRQSAASRTGVPDVLADLNEQYYEALETSQVPVAGSMAAGTVVHPFIATKSSDEREADIHGLASITELLSDIEKLDDAFGALLEGESGAFAEREAIPEVLRLFAPRDYQAGRLRRGAAVPPNLAQRDHHTLAIDSPLRVPGGETGHASQSSESRAAVAGGNL